MMFIGVVEDRSDPLEMGRVRVRVIGDHVPDKTKIPTESLPWAQVVLPVTSASTGGIGQSPTGLVPGSWVVGMYIDGDHKQQPLIFGSIHGFPAPPDSEYGFADPNGVHPVRYNETDAPLAASETTYVDHPSYFARNDVRQTAIETAVPPRIGMANDNPGDAYYERNSWDMPLPYGGRPPVYPYNNVTEYEGGHLFEVDSTMGNRRIAMFHASGTNYEISEEGTRSTHIEGADYKVVVEDNNVYIMGNCNLTVDKDLRMLVKGNYHLEVQGDKTEIVHKKRQTKIGTSEHIEIGQEFASNVNKAYMQRIGTNETRIVEGNRNTNITGGNDTLVIGKGNYTRSTMAGTQTVYSKGKYQLATVGTLGVTAQGDITIESPSALTENIEGNISINTNSDITTNASNLTDNISGNVDINGARIDLN